jgi:predicted small integral membrane protein
VPAATVSARASTRISMILRISKTILVLAVAFYTTLIVFNNFTDYASNYEFVRHVLMMDSTFPNNHGMWRAMNSPPWHHIFYWMIIAWEFTSVLLCWWGGWSLMASLRNERQFRHAKHIAIAGLTLNLLLWLVAFLAIGGEWFLMWQSKTWNGQEAAFRMAAIVGIVLVFVTQSEDQEERT